MPGGSVLHLMPDHVNDSCFHLGHIRLRRFHSHLRVSAACLLILVAGFVMATAQCESDTVPPTFDGPTSESDGVLDENCFTHVEFAATVYDDCGINAMGVTLHPDVAGAPIVDQGTTLYEITQVNSTTVEVFLSLDVVGMQLAPASISLYIQATDLNGNSSTSTTATVDLSDAFAPAITALTVTPDDGIMGRIALGETAGEMVTVEVTAEDNCCIDLTDWLEGGAPIVFDAPGAWTWGPVTVTPDTSGLPSVMAISSTYYVYGLTAASTTPTATVTITDCCGTSASSSAAGSPIVDDEPPQSYIDYVYVHPEDDSPYTDATCSRTVLFSTAIMDNCALDLDSIDVSATAANADISNLAVTVTPSEVPGPDGEPLSVCMQATIEGSFVVSNLADCCATPTVEVSVSDEAGNQATWSSDDSPVACTIYVGTAPIVSAVSLTPDSDTLDEDCGVTFTYAATVSHPCTGTLTADDLRVEPHVTNGTVSGHSSLVEEDPEQPGTWLLSGSFRANCDGSLSGSSCAVLASVFVHANLCVGQERQELLIAHTEDSPVTITDSRNPTINGFELTTTSTDFEPEGTWVQYQATISDNCELNLDMPWISVTAEPIVTGAATVSTPTVTASPPSGVTTQATVSGGFMVSGFAGCSVDVEVTIMAVDGCARTVSESRTIRLEDQTKPSVGDVIFTPTDGTWDVSDSCEQGVDFVVIVTDNYCIDPANISVAPSAAGGAVKDLTVTKSPDSGTADEVIVTGSFIVYGLNACLASPSLTVNAEDCCGLVTTSTQVGPDIRDDIIPVIVWETAPPGEIQYVDDACSVTVPIAARITDNCCILPENVAIAIDEITGNANLSHTVSASADGDDVLVSGTVTVSDLSGCPATVRIRLDAQDCCGNLAAQLEGSFDVSDDIVPVVSALVVSNELVSDECCLATVTFVAEVTDNCCLSWEAVTVDVSLPTGNAVLETIDPHVSQIDANRVEIVGSADVRCLTSCPARVQVTINAVDCCGNSADTRTSKIDEGLVIDTSPPEAHDDPDGDEERSSGDGLDVRVDSADQHRIPVRENASVWIDLLSNDDDNCTRKSESNPCHCGAPLWIATCGSPDHGIVAVNGVVDAAHALGPIRYQPDQGYVGPDQFAYRSVDSCGNVSEVATVFLYVTPTTQIDDLELTACADRSVSFDLVGADPLVGDVDFAFSVRSGPLHGVLLGDVGEIEITASGSTVDEPGTATIHLIYVPAAGFVGRDSITIEFSDPFGSSGLSFVDVQVILCGAAVDALPQVSVEQGVTVHLVVPETFSAILSTDHEAVLLVSLETGEDYSGTVSVIWEEELGRFVLLVNTESLPLGRYEMTIPFGPGEAVVFIISVEEAE